MDKKYKLERLSNGIKVLYIPIKKSNIIYLEFSILNGTINENKKTLEHGHFLEHMNSKFTSEKYPNALENIKTLSHLGCKTNASINSYITQYYIQGPTVHSKKLLDIILNSYSKFKIDKTIFKQEKRSVIEELRSYDNDQWSNLEEKMNKEIYKNHPYEHTYRDRIKNTKKTTIKELYQFRKKHYKTTNTLFIIAGDFEENKCKQYIRRILSEMTKTKTSKNYPQYEYKLNKIPKLIYVKNDTLSTKLTIRFQIPYTTFEANKNMIDVLPKILTNGLDSRLYKLRHKHGLIYYISSEIETDYMNKKLSSFTIQTEVDSNSIKKVIEIILEEIKLLKDQGVTDAEINKVKNIFLMEQFEHKMTSNIYDYVEMYSENVVFDKKIYTFKEYYEMRKNITKNKIRIIARSIFDEKRMVIGYSGKQKINL